MIKASSLSNERLERSITLAPYPRFFLLSVALTCMFVITWYMQLGSRVSLLGSIRFEMLLGLALIMLTAFNTNYKLGRKFHNPVSTYVKLYFAILLLHVILSVDFSYSRQIFTDRVLKFAMLGFFIVCFINSPRALRWFLAAYLLAALKISSEGFLGWLSGSLMWQNQGIMRLHGVTNNFLHPNSFSGFAVGLLPFVYFLLPVVKRWQQIILIMLGVFALIIVVYTGSRTGYVGVLGTLAYIVYTTKDKKRALRIVGLGCVLALSVLPLQYVERFESIFSGQEKEGRSSEKRLEIIEDAWHIFLENPLGVGVAAFPIVRARKFGRSQDTHNLYLEALTNIGVHGFLVFMLLVRSLLIGLRRLREEFYKQLVTLDGLNCTSIDSRVEESGDELTEHRGDLRLMLALSNAVSAFIVARLCLGMFGMDLYEIYWWLALGLFTSLWRMNVVSQKRTKSLENRLADQTS